MEQNCSGACDSHSHKERELSRRALLGGFATLLAGVGLTGLGASAAEAATKYKVTAAKNVPVDSAKVFTVKGKSILITQPKAGVFRAFANRCTHQGAALGPQALNNQNLMCRQHGASFNASNGAVVGGPATRALTRYTVTTINKNLYVSI